MEPWVLPNPIYGRFFLVCCALTNGTVAQVYTVTILFPKDQRKLISSTQKNSQEDTYARSMKDDPLGDPVTPETSRILDAKS